ncbi:response regulator [Conexibacter sp. W3-3-2]|uniref:hybrid sensor histidine kinase/response regulator n=1 Tax=Conexibacter sp. W3-3-2 TaxID=2675227 RepID=UPI0012B72533|nr:ATP-binding protein [Conexibacter sp. W3-3-2]MTD44986.1 response regulator [Conexibacter sp. W3-3-2]
MRRLSIARSLQLALLGLTVALTAIAALGVGALYQSRQDYEDRLAEGLQLQASAGRLLAAGVVEEATLRLRRGPDGLTERRRARAAYRAANREALALAQGDAASTEAITAAAAGQQLLRLRPTSATAPLAAREPLARLSRRQTQRIADARDEAQSETRRAVIAIVSGGGLAFLVALVLIAALVAAVRRPLDDLVGASARLAGGEDDARVREDGPDELRLLARSFNQMAGDVQDAATRLRRERDRLDVTVRSLGDALVQTDADGVVVSANPRAGELVPELAVGTVLDAASAPAELAQALEGEVVVEQDETRTLAITAARLPEQGGVVWTIRDVSERARLERLKSEFVATASHELRSPLTSIKGFVELLASGEDLQPRQREFLDIVLVSTNRLVDLVNDLLDVARVEAGRLEIHRRPTALHEVVQEVTTLFGPRLATKRQRLSVDVPEDLPRAHADPARVRQILTNLLTNAHLYTQEGGAISITGRADGRSAVRFDVADDGRGMSREEIATVFDRFVRVGGEGDRTTGSGLGLSIVKSLVDLHEGRVDVESAPGVGTTFSVRLPVSSAVGTTAAARDALRGKRVLVVDDEEDVARLVAERLVDFGVQTEIARDGAGALERLRAERFDAVTLDILMPGMSGFEVMRALRADPDLARLPVVVVSVFSGREALSGEWVVSKPIDPGELADALGAAVLADRVRVLAVGRPEIRDELDRGLTALGIEHEWATSPQEATARCAQRYYEVALVDAGLPDAAQVIAGLDLRGRRLRRSVVVFGSADDEISGYARLDAEPVPISDAGAVVLGLLDAPVGSRAQDG